MTTEIIDLEDFDGTTFDWFVDANVTKGNLVYTGE